MDIITKDTINHLIENSVGKAVSIYMPMFIPAQEAEQNPIRLKTLIKEVKNQLSDANIGGSKINTFLAPLEELIEDEYFWHEKSEGLAIFLDEEDFYIYRLPAQVEQIAIVSDVFHVTPLISMYNGEGHFFLLSIAQERPRLYQGSKFRLAEIEEINLPESLQKMFNEYFEFHDHLNFHTKSSTPNTSLAGGRDGMHFGQGGENIDKEAEIRNFFHRFDDALMSYLSGQNSPLVLAGVEFLHPLYKEANTYTNLVEDGITKDVDQMDEEKLHQKAWEIVKNNYQTNVDEAIGVYHKLQENNGDTSNNIETIVSSAYFQRVHTLFIAKNEHIWGVFNPEENQTRIHDKPSHENQDLLSIAASYTLINGGKVLVLPKETIPDGSLAAAILRY